MNATVNVIDNGMCAGCGACAFAEPDRFRMGLTSAGHWQARRIANGNGPAETICPMSGEGMNETEIAESRFPGLDHTPETGFFRSVRVGHVAEGSFREKGGSGGLVTWLLTELLRTGEIDAVIHVKPNQVGDLLFAYGVSHSVEEIRAGAKSRYYPVEMSQVLTILRDTDRRYALVGLPCFIKSARKLSDVGLIDKDRLKYSIGLFCGHLKSRYFADYLAWQKGAEPGSLAGFDFRHKLPGRSAARYGFSFRTSRNAGQGETAYPMDTVRGGDWGQGLFKNPACEYCDDVMAECADIAIGDAWLPEYVADHRGTSIVISRSKDLDDLLSRARSQGRVVLHDVPADDAIRSQSSGLRHRREGLAHRLARRTSRGQWVPEKRVSAQLAPTFLARRIYDLREKFARRSSELFRQTLDADGTLDDFQAKLVPLLTEYKVMLKARRLSERLRKRLLT